MGDYIPVLTMISTERRLRGFQNFDFRVSEYARVGRRCRRQFVSLLFLIRDRSGVKLWIRKASVLTFSFGK